MYFGVPLLILLQWIKMCDINSTNTHAVLPNKLCSLQPLDSTTFSLKLFFLHISLSKNICLLNSFFPFFKNTWSHIPIWDGTSWAIGKLRHTTWNYRWCTYKAFHPLNWHVKLAVTATLSQTFSTTEKGPVKIIHNHNQVSKGCMDFVAIRTEENTDSVNDLFYLYACHTKDKDPSFLWHI